MLEKQLQNNYCIHSITLYMYVLLLYFLKNFLGENLKIEWSQNYMRVLKVS